MSSSQRVHHFFIDNNSYIIYDNVDQQFEYFVNQVPTCDLSGPLIFCVIAEKKCSKKAKMLKALKSTHLYLYFLQIQQFSFFIPITALDIGQHQVQSNANLKLRSCKKLQANTVFLTLD